MGHCYFLEDGAEMATSLVDNLAAGIMVARNGFATDKKYINLLFIWNISSKKKTQLCYIHFHDIKPPCLSSYRGEMKLHFLLRVNQSGPLTLYQMSKF